MCVIKEADLMLEGYILFPNSRMQLGNQLKQLCDNYSTGRVSNQDFVELLRQWQKTCDFFIHENGKVQSGVVHYIGKRRASMVEKALNV